MISKCSREEAALRCAKIGLDPDRVLPKPSIPEKQEPRDHYIQNLRIVPLFTKGDQEYVIITGEYVQQFHGAEPFVKKVSYEGLARKVDEEFDTPTFLERARYILPF